MSFLSKVLDLLFPPKCMFCRKVLERGIGGSCPECRERLICQDPPKRGDWFSQCVSPLRYEGEVREALLRFKFRQRPGYATELGGILAQCIREELAGEYDLISWVPVSPERRKQRGYDQAMLLSMAAALELGDVAVETLTKVAHNAAQSGMKSAEDRKKNVMDVYEAADSELIYEKRILLIDDIITTGATLDEASRTLLMAGAKQVVCAAVAHTVEQHKEEESLCQE